MIAAVHGRVVNVVHIRGPRMVHVRPEVLGEIVVLQQQLQAALLKSAQRGKEKTIPPDKRIVDVEHIRKAAPQTLHGKLNRGSEPIHRFFRVLDYFPAGIVAEVGDDCGGYSIEVRRLHVGLAGYDQNFVARLQQRTRLLAYDGRNAVAGQVVMDQGDTHGLVSTRQ